MGINVQARNVGKRVLHLEWRGSGPIIVFLPSEAVEVESEVSVCIHA